MSRQTTSLRRRLLLQLLVVAAVLSALLYITVRAVAGHAAEATQDNILGASASAIVEQLGSTDEGVSIDIPYAAFSMLGAISEDRIFYRIIVNDLTVTGYEDLPLPEATPDTVIPSYFTAAMRGTTVRVAALRRIVPIANDHVDVVVLVAQTRLGQAAITARVANTAAGLGIGFFILAGILSWVAATSALAPMRRVAAGVARRGPHDLRPMSQPVPSELAPLVVSLNGFMARLQGALNLTETFIAEAAHHVRTPLATVRTQTEIALRQADSDDSRHALRAVIRAVDESSRSAGQLLDHAMVSYRSDHIARERLDLREVTDHVVRSLTPTAELKDLTLELDIAKGDMALMGDRVLIESAMRNILDNAIKYSPAESRIDITLTSREARIDFTVCDQGRGLGGATQAALMERFGRGANTGDIVGSGLGLTIVAEVARSHGGTFTLEEQTGDGTCAILSLPQ